jgi:hypothetical protein
MSDIVTTLRNAIAETSYNVNAVGNGDYAVADAILAMPEMQEIRRALREHARWDQDYWHPDEERVSPAVREWVTG